MKLQQIHIKISGRVQGVGFRQNAFFQAKKLGVFGWVRNTFDGEVEILAEGDSQSIKFFLEWCHEGPPHAVVSEVQILRSVEIAELAMKQFSIESTV